MIVAHRESPLTLLVHYADYWTAHIYEDDNMRKMVTEEDYCNVIQNKGEVIHGQFPGEVKSLKTRDGVYK